MSETSKKSTISIHVELDKENIPMNIEWMSDDKPDNKLESAKAFMLSIFDKDHKDTLKIDLWTKEMQISEMDRFIYNTLKGLADTYVRATNNTALANEMRQFIQHFGERTQILKRES